MTRPIYEQTETRDVSVLGYTDARLFRRPAPVGPVAAAVYSAYVHRELTSGTVTGGTIHPIATSSTDDFESPDQSDLEISTRASDSRLGIRVNTPGIYLATFQARVAQNAANIAMFRLCDLADGTCPGLLDDDVGIDWIRPTVPQNLVTMFQSLTWLLVIQDNNDDWDDDLSGGHGLPLRIGVEGRHNEAANRALAGDLIVGKIHSLPEV